MEWQPIETAPEQRDLLVWWECEMSGRGMFSVAGKDHRGRWISDEDGLIAPTHWMIPDPPK